MLLGKSNKGPNSRHLCPAISAFQNLPVFKKNELVMLALSYDFSHL